MGKNDIWLIGRWQQRDFAAVRKWLARRGSCRRFASIAAAMAHCRPAHAKDPLPTLIVAQSRAGEVSLGDLAKLGSEMPQTRLIVLDGPWCEGEHRGGRFVPGVERVPWRRWRVGLEAAMTRMMPVITGANGQDAKAIAAAELENGLRSVGQRRRAGRAAMWTANRATSSYLSDALGRLGFEAQWLGGSGRFTAAADVILYDGWEYVLPIPVGPAPHTLHGTPQRALPTRLLLLNFPRPDDALAAQAFGIDAVLALPLMLADLARTLPTLTSDL